MTETVINTIVTIIGIVVGISGLFFGSKIIYKKYIGRDDYSIDIKNSTIVKRSAVLVTVQFS